MNEVKVRGDRSIEWMVRDRVYTAGDIVRVDFMARHFTNMTGYQYTLNYDDAKLDVIRAESGMLAVTEDHFGMLDGGVITTVWHDIRSRSFDDQDVLFTLVFTARAQGRLSEMLYVNSAVTRAIAYDKDLNAMDVELGFRNNSHTTSNAFELYQNVPNPFAGKTTIGFNLPEAMDAQVTIYDIVGKVLKQVGTEGHSGYNEISVQAEELAGNGIIYYQLNAGTYSATRKMIITK